MALFLPSLGFGQVVINELMASNGSVIELNGQYLDWIELYNASGQAMDLSGHWLSDDPSAPLKYQLPVAQAELTIPANGHLLLWADASPDAGPAHLGFSLSAQGEWVLLSTPDGTLLDIVEFGRQVQDVSFGREIDGFGAWKYLSPATPDASNNGSASFLGVLPPPVLSMDPSFHPGPFDMEITSPVAGAEIWYTLDGSTPDPLDEGGREYVYKNEFPHTSTSAFGPFIPDTVRSFLYQGNVHIDDITDTPNHLSGRNTTRPPPYHLPNTIIRKGRVLRARAYKEGYLPSDVITASYIITPGGTNPFELPVLFFTSDPDDLFGYDKGLLTAGEDFDNWRLLNPNASAGNATPSNWIRKTEFPVSLEYVDVGAIQPAFRTNAGYRIHGGSTRTMPRKTFRLHFRNRYGASTLQHQLFPEQSYPDHKRLLIRQSGSDQQLTNMRDWYGQEVSGAGTTTFDTQAYLPHVLFINGEFWGVHFLIERYDTHYLERNYGLPRDEVDLLAFNSVNADVEAGSISNYTALISHVMSNPMTSDEDYDHLSEQVDLDNFIEYYSSQIFVGNTDWPRNNVRYFRKQTPFTPEAPTGHDGRWRWLMYDLDHTFRHNNSFPASHDFLARTLVASGAHEASTRLFRRSMLNDRFRKDFISRHADLLNTAYRPSVAGSILDGLKAHIAADMNEHFTRWIGDPGSLGAWNNRLGVIQAFINARQGFAREEVITHLGVPAMHSVTIDVSSPDHGYVRVNSIDLLPTTHGVDEQPWPWTGVYYQDVPIKLVARAHPGWNFSHWEGDVHTTTDTLVIELADSLSVTAVFVPGVLCEMELMHYWHFNTLPSGTLQTVVSDESVIPGAQISYMGEGAGLMDRTGQLEGSAMNAQEGVEPGRALRVRNPSIDRHLIIEVPSTGYRDVELAFATRRTVAGPDSQLVEWTVDPLRQEWHPTVAGHRVWEQYMIRTFKPGNGLLASHSPHLAFRVNFIGSNTTNASGNSRFDNLTLRGMPVEGVDMVVCKEDEYTYEGEVYPVPGDHLVEIPGVMDCGHLRLLRLLRVEADTTVLQNGTILEALQSGAEYQWVDCDNGFEPITSASGPVFMAGQDGSYAVELVIDGCTFISSCLQVLGTGIRGSEGAGMAIYPDPTLDVVNIVLEGGTTGAIISVLDPTGAVVRTVRSAGERTAIDLSGLSAGSYIIQVQGDLILRRRITKL